MKKIIALLFLIIVANCTFAQQNDYDLSNYKTGDYKRKSLDFNIGSSGFFKNDMSDGKQQNFTGSLSATYNQTKNTRKLIEIMSVGVGGSLNFAKDDDKQSTSTAIYNNKNQTNSNDYYLNFNRQGFHYINENNLFIEFSPSGSLSRSNSINKVRTDRFDFYGGVRDIYTDRSENNSLNANAQINIGIGKGRIEYVEDARQALYILDELKQKGILLKDLTTEEINVMAATITRIKNKRQFDSRIRLIEEIETIDSLLVANGYINKSNSTAYFTSLYDNWMYANTPERMSGSRFSVGLRPQYSFYRNTYEAKYEYYDYEYNGKDISTLYMGSLYIDYSYEKPVKLKFQNSLYLSLLNSWGKARNTHSMVQSVLNASYGWGYYPNTRTYAGIGVSQHLNWIRYEKDDSQLFSTTALTANAYYYLSPQLRLFGACNIAYSLIRDLNDNENINDKHPRTSFSLGMTYSFF